MRKTHTLDGRAKTLIGPHGPLSSIPRQSVALQGAQTPRQLRGEVIPTDTDVRAMQKAQAKRESRKQR